jgi:glycosyltransferase involved in cell wall biosynthesis
LRIAFLIPDLGIGGGNSVVLAYARIAAAAGHEVTVVVTTGAPSGPEMSPIGGPRVASLAQASDTKFDVAIASWWQDTLLLPQLSASRHARFLQGMEDRIYRRNEPQRALAQDAYRVPLPGITVSHRLKERFRLEYNRSLAVVPNGLDKSIFRPDGHTVAPRGNSVRVLVEGPLGVWHKNVLPALRMARSVSAETWLLTSTDVGPISGVDRVFSCLPSTDTAAVYRSCDILLKLSLVEGFGLPPLEMFHCGGTVVAFDGPSTAITEYAQHGRNALLAPAPDFVAAGQHLEALLDDRDLMDTMQSGALETARSWPSQREAGERFLRALETLIETQPTTDARVLSRLESLSRSLACTAPQALRRLRGRLGRGRLVRSIRHSIEIRTPTAG